MSETVEVDRDYLWALEVLAVGRIRSESEVTRSDFKEARRVVDDANLERPRDKSDTTQRGTGVSTEGQRW